MNAFRKSAYSALLTLAFGSVVAAQSAFSAAALTGDLNGSGDFTLDDARAALQIYTDTLTGYDPELTDIQLLSADLDCDSLIGLTDAQIMLQYYVLRLVGRQPTWEALVPATESMPLTPADGAEALFGDYYLKAAVTVSQMTTEEKVSQLFLVSYPGYQAASAEVPSEGCPCGYVLFADDFRYQTPDSLRTQMEALKGESTYGLLLGGDEEGGGVVRASMFSAFRDSAFPSPMQLFAAGGLEAIFSDAAEKAAFLQNIGLNYNLAPVVDMPKSAYSYIYSRSLGQDAETTSAYSAGVVNIMNESGTLATLKHFPGYGDNLDTHTLVSVDTRTKEDFQTRDFQPFVSGIEAGVPMIMVNHNIVNCMDSTKPASLSEEVHRVLREELGFSGLILTDGLTMGAIQQYASNGEAAVQAILCGNDIIATLSYADQRAEVSNAVNSGRIPMVMVNDAVRRIIACKYYYGVLE